MNDEKIKYCDVIMRKWEVKSRKINKENKHE